MTYRFSNKGKEYSFDTNQLSSDELAKFNKLTSHQKERFITAWNLENESDMKDEISLATVEEPSKTTNFINSVIAKYQQKVDALRKNKNKSLDKLKPIITEADLNGFRKTYGTEPTVDYLIKYFEKYIEDLNSGTVDTKALYYAEELLKKLKVNYKKFLKDYVIPDVEKNGSSRYLNSQGEVIIGMIPKDTDLEKTIENAHLDEKNKTAEGGMKDLKGAITDLRETIEKVQVPVNRRLGGPGEQTPSLQSNASETNASEENKQDNEGNLSEETDKVEIVNDITGTTKKEDKELKDNPKNLLPENSVWDEYSGKFDNIVRNNNFATIDKPISYKTVYETKKINGKIVQTSEKVPNETITIYDINNIPNDLNRSVAIFANLLNNPNVPHKYPGKRNYKFTKGNERYKKIKDDFNNDLDTDLDNIDIHKYVSYDNIGTNAYPVNVLFYPLGRGKVDYIKGFLKELYARNDLPTYIKNNGINEEKFWPALNEFIKVERRRGRGIKDVFNRLRGKDTKDLTQRLNELGRMINTYNTKAEKQEQRLKEILHEIDDIKKDVSGIKKHDEQQDSKIKDLSNKPTVQPDEMKPRPNFLNDITKPSQLKPVEPTEKPNEAIPEWQKILNERRKDIEPDEPEDDESEDWGAGITKRMSLKEYLEMIN
jgi:hypothetical protein